MENLYKEHLSRVLKTFDKILEKYEYEQIIIYSGEVNLVYQDDNTYPFKANFNFKYLVPIENYPYSFIVYKINCKPKVYLFQKEDYWDSQPKDIEAFWTKYFDICYFSKLDKLDSFLDSNLSQTLLLAQDAKRFENKKFKSINDSEVIKAINYARSIKSSYEIECIKEANFLASKAHLKAMKAFFKGKSEFQTNLAYLKAINFKESEVPYPNIVAFDTNCAVLHYVDYNREKTDAKSFLLDAGASFNGYHSDVTRTFVKDSNEEFKALIKAINTCNLNIISKVTIGLNYEELQEQMHKDIAKILVDFKLMNISYDEIYEKEYTKVFSPTGVGHYIGLQVHDVGNINKSKKHPFLRLTRDLEEGNVFTIEPGIYFIEQLLRPYLNNKKFNWKNINRLKEYGGVRIEDNIAIKNHQVVNLTRPYFKEIDSLI